MELKAKRFIGADNTEKYEKVENWRTVINLGSSIRDLADRVLHVQKLRALISLHKAGRFRGYVASNHSRWNNNNGVSEPLCAIT